MRPSNKFEEVTENEYQRRENEKNLYKLELQQQIDAQK